MPVKRAWILLSAMIAVGCCIVAGLARGSVLFARIQAPAEQAAVGGGAWRQEIDAFNRKYIEAHLKMDNGAIMSTWAVDGVALLPATKPIEGKTAIATFLAQVTSPLTGYHMENVEMDFQGIEVHGDWASEWANEHQRIQPPEGKAAIDSYGKILLVLHREADGNWRVKREMWNQGLKP
jgi:uncharacterized protein (TIGR02246 family)